MARAIFAGIFCAGLFGCSIPDKEFPLSDLTADMPLALAEEYVGSTSPLPLKVDEVIYPIALWQHQELRKVEGGTRARFVADYSGGLLFPLVTLDQRAYFDKKGIQLRYDGGGFRCRPDPGRGELLRTRGSGTVASQDGGSSHDLRRSVQVLSH